MYCVLRSENFEIFELIGVFETPPRSQDFFIGMCWGNFKNALISWKQANASILAYTERDIDIFVQN